MVSQVSRGWPVCPWGCDSPGAVSIPCSSLLLLLHPPLSLSARSSTPPPPPPSYSSTSSSSSSQLTGPLSHNLWGCQLTPYSWLEPGCKPYLLGFQGGLAQSIGSWQSYLFVCLFYYVLLLDPSVLMDLAGSIPLQHHQLVGWDHQDSGNGHVVKSDHTLYNNKNK